MVSHITTTDDCLSSTSSNHGTALFYLCHRPTATIQAKRTSPEKGSGNNLKSSEKFVLQTWPEHSSCPRRVRNFLLVSQHEIRCGTKLEQQWPFRWNTMEFELWINQRALLVLHGSQRLQSAFSDMLSSSSSCCLFLPLNLLTAAEKSTSCAQQVIKSKRENTTFPRLCSYRDCADEAITFSSNRQLFGLSIEGPPGSRGWLRVSIASYATVDQTNLIDIPFLLTYCPLGFYLLHSNTSCKVSNGCKFPLKTVFLLSLWPHTCV